tara:strand:- start:641 stop:901 length:261 start_codon:yes stop_codon:yes gene_type:complete
MMIIHLQPRINHRVIVHNNLINVIGPGKPVKASVLCAPSSIVIVFHLLVPKRILITFVKVVMKLILNQMKRQIYQTQMIVYVPYPP